jgi:hypothetical protein
MAPPVKHQASPPTPLKPAQAASVDAAGSRMEAPAGRCKLRCRACALGPPTAKNPLLAGPGGDPVRRHSFLAPQSLLGVLEYMNDKWVVPRMDDAQFTSSIGYERAAMPNVPPP